MSDGAIASPVRRCVHLILRAANEREELGYITQATRSALVDAGYTPATIEAALHNVRGNS